MNLEIRNHVFTLIHACGLQARAPRTPAGGIQATRTAPLHWREQPACRLRVSMTLCGAKLGGKIFKYYTGDLVYLLQNYRIQPHKILQIVVFKPYVKYVYYFRSWGNCIVEESPPYIYHLGATRHARRGAMPRTWTVLTDCMTLCSALPGPVNAILCLVACAPMPCDALALTASCIFVSTQCYSFLLDDPPQKRPVFQGVLQIRCPDKSTTPAHNPHFRASFALSSS